ncbi:MAG: DUF4912 domain-containing protein [wastewater metagenome]|nr:DUF4912 domain-containing protein [Candidatus Loosdrechtia aerotolerans]
MMLLIQVKFVFCNYLKMLIMDKTIIKEIFLLSIEVIKALGQILWKKMRHFVGFIRDKIFRIIGISQQKEATEQEWGVTGEDIWPSTLETEHEESKEVQQEKKEVQPVYESPFTSEEKQGITDEGALSITAEAPRRREDIEQKYGDGKKKEFAPPPPIPELPEGYKDNRIVLMMRDPSCLFTYWELRQDLIQNVLSTLGPLAQRITLVLRVYIVTGTTFTGNNARRYFDIEVADTTRSRYIHGEPNTSYCIDIGFLSPNGTFRILSRSNTVQTPPVGISEIVDEKWMYSKELYEEGYFSLGPGSEFMFKRVQKDRHKILKEGALSFISSGDFVTSKG